MSMKVEAPSERPRKPDRIREMQIKGRSWHLRPAGGI